MRKNWILIIILILFFSTNSFALNYNSSNSDLMIDQNGWCANIDVNFKVYNKTEYELYNKVRRKN